MVVADPFAAGSKARLPGDVLIDHIRLVTAGGRLSAVVTRHP
jgi:hypothetical protein